MPTDRMLSLDKCWLTLRTERGAVVLYVGDEPVWRPIALTPEQAERLSKKLRARAARARPRKK